MNTKKTRLMLYSEEKFNKSQEELHKQDVIIEQQSKVIEKLIEALEFSGSEFYKMQKLALGNVKDIRKTLEEIKNERN